MLKVKKIKFGTKKIFLDLSNSWAVDSNEQPFGVVTSEKQGLIDCFETKQVCDQIVNKAAVEWQCTAGRYEYVIRSCNRAVENWLQIKRPFPHTF